MSLFDGDGCKEFVGTLVPGGTDAIRAALEDAQAHPARALAAAEVVASAAGEPPDELPDEAREWIETHGVPDDALVELALRTAHDLCARPDLRAGGGDEWLRAVRDLRYRLGDVAAP
jgi:radical SAM superfamily enzyme